MGDTSTVEHVIPRKQTNEGLTHEQSVLPVNVKDDLESHGEPLCLT